MAVDSNFNPNEQQTTQQNGYDTYGQPQPGPEPNMQGSYTQQGFDQNAQGSYTQQGFDQNVNYVPYGQPAQKIPGQGAATAAFVCGIIGLLLSFAVYFGVFAVGLGIAGLILAANAKKAGFQGGLRTAGFVLSLIALILGALEIVACLGCIGFFVSTGASTPEYMQEFERFSDMF